LAESQLICFVQVGRFDLSVQKKYSCTVLNCMNSVSVSQTSLLCYYSAHKTYFFLMQLLKNTEKCKFERM